MHPPTRTHRLESQAAGALEALVAALPERLADRVGAGVGTLLYWPLRVRLATVAANLRAAFPEASKRWIARTTRRAYQHLGREAAAMVRLARATPADVIERTALDGWEEFAAAVKEGRGVVVAAGHFGNWEVAAAAAAARGVPVSAIVQRQTNPLIFARIQERRHRLGVHTIERGDAPRQVPRALRAGHAVGVVIDQDARRSGVWVPFFGIPSSTSRGAALFSLRFETPVFSISGLRLPGDLRYRVRFERVVPLRTGDLGADVIALTAELTARLEAMVRQHPEQYFWFHRRWKTTPPTEPALVGSGTNLPDKRNALFGDDPA